VKSEEVRGRRRSQRVEARGERLRLRIKSEELRFKREEKRGKRKGGVNRLGGQCVLAFPPVLIFDG
jgi:hypothetical protein